jgi:hypothetical protein
MFLKDGDDLWPLLFNFVVKNAHRKVQANRKNCNYMGHVASGIG